MRLQPIRTSSNPYYPVPLFKATVDWITKNLEVESSKTDTLHPFRFAKSSASDELPKITHDLIDSLGEEGYQLLQPIPVEIHRIGIGEYEAGFREANIAIAGISDQDAYESLVAEILDTFDTLSSTSNMGPDAARQLRVLREHIIKT